MNLLAGHVRNIWKVWLQATPDERTHGPAAYAKYRLRIRDLAQVNGPSSVTLRQAAGVFAALSPNAGEQDAMSGLCVLLRAFRDGVPLNQVRCRAYPDNRRKAWSILEGRDPLDVLAGPKTRNFFLNILNPTDPVPVTVDAHAYSVWVGRRLKVTEPRISERAYASAAADYRLAGSWAGVRGNQIRAVCWFAWRRLHGLGAVNIKQYTLFDLCEEESA